jgi:monoamine oxidase
VAVNADSGTPAQYSKAGILTAFMFADDARKAFDLDPAERRKLVLDGGEALWSSRARAQALCGDELGDASLD